jgi:cephalosporin hydroxylase
VSLRSRLAKRIRGSEPAQVPVPPQPVEDMQLPGTVGMDVEGSVANYYHRRAVQSAQDWYCGVRMAKFPEDLRTYEHLMWRSRADTVIEIGTAFGGSALWFRDRLTALQHYGRAGSPRVISIDVEVGRPRELLDRADPSWSERIDLVEGDVTDPELPERVRRLVPEGARCFVVEDSAHVRETTAAALRGFAGFVPVGGFFVVEDGYVDVPELVPGPEWGWSGVPHGVLPALDEWLQTEEGRRFERRPEYELYGLTSHPRGFLERVREPA